jgi:hypothetical protein
MADSPSDQQTQKTLKDHEIPLPIRKSIFAAFQKMATGSEKANRAPSSACSFDSSAPCYFRTGSE